MARGNAFIEIDGPWRELAETLLTSKIPIHEEELALATKFAEETKATAQEFLNKLVYETPEPADYTRTHDTYNAIKARVNDDGEVITGEAFVDPTDFKRYPYYLSLEFGLPLGRWFAWGNPVNRPYYPRPFWRSTKAVMKVKYRRMESETLDRITARIGRGFV